MGKTPFNVKVFFNGSELPIDPNGYLGMLRPGTARIQVTCSQADIHAFSVDGNKRITLLKVRRDNCIGTKWFRADVHLEQRHQQVCTLVAKVPGREQVIPVYPNSVRLVELAQLGGFNIWEVSIIGWKGNFFLKSQLVHTATLFRDGDRVKCPYFAEKYRSWPHLIEMCGELAREAGIQIPNISLYAQDSAVTPGGLAQGQAIVIHFEYAHMFGVARLRNGNSILVLPDQLPVRNGELLPYLELGEVVRVKSVEKLPRRDKPSFFTHEAIGVSLAS